MAETGQICVMTRAHHGRRPLTETGLVCSQCLADLRDLLADVGDLWRELPYSSLTLARLGGGNPEVKPPRHDFASEPVNLTALALHLPGTHDLGSIAPRVRRNGPRLESNGSEVPNVLAVLSAWCATISRGRNTEVEASTVTAMIDELRHHLTWITGQTWVVDLESELRACRRSLAAATNQPALRRPICSCPDCGGAVWTDQDRKVNDLLAQNKPVEDPLPGRLDLADCAKCGKRWDGWAAMRILGRMVEDEGARGRPA